VELYSLAEALPQALAYTPKPPTSVAETAVPQALLADLLLKRLSLQGEATLTSLAHTLKLTFPVVRELFQQLRQQQYFEVKGIEGSDYRFTLTSAGRALAAERLQVNQYAGAAPVSLPSYHESVRDQAATLDLHRETLRAAFSDLVLTDGLLDQLGPALVSQKAIFLYGPTGNGKTSLAERLLRVFDDVVLVPYAVEVDGQVIVLYDPALHHPVALPQLDLDPRWVPCRRPSVLVGGELDRGMLELQRDESTGIYAAPVQMKANNGILVIDDFGRQVLSPTYLLNRWIVPLDRGVDYLTLKYGVKLEIPFQLLVVFATNLAPADLADEAFFRRIPNKIFVGPVQPEHFDQIFARFAAARGLACDEGAAAHLRHLCLGRGDGQLRACYPRDLVGILRSIRAYRGEPLRVDREGLEEAVDLYFADQGTQAAGEGATLRGVAKPQGAREC